MKALIFAISLLIAVPVMAGEQETFRKWALPPQPRGGILEDLSPADRELIRLMMLMYMMKSDGGSPTPSTPPATDNPAFYSPKAPRCSDSFYPNPAFPYFSVRQTLICQVCTYPDGRPPVTTCN